MSSFPAAFPRPRAALVLPPAASDALSATDALAQLASLSRRMGISDREALVGDESSMETALPVPTCHDVTRADLTFFDPGPGKDEVDFGFNCGCCSKFVRWDDPLRSDPYFMASTVQRDHCPRLTLHEQPIPRSFPLEEFIPQADQAGCDAFALDADRAPAAVATIVEQLDGLSFDELSVVGYEVYRAFLAKKHGERFGYELGAEFSVRKAGRPIMVRVIGFQRKSGEEVIVANVHDLAQVFTLPALRVKQ